jgi:putative transposase
MLGAHSDTLVLVHVVFATADRKPWLTREFDGWFADAARAACARMGCELLAVGNASDHAHVVLVLSASVALAEVVRRLKGGSSHAWNARQGGRPLRWQTGYWARSIEQESLGQLMAYVRDQRGRHAAETTRSAWEQHEATLVGPEGMQPP